MLQLRIFVTKMIRLSILIVIFAMLSILGCQKNTVAPIEPVEGLEFVQIPAGSFTMGSPPSEAEREASEGPQRIVTITSFYLKSKPVTQGEWFEVMGTTVEQQKEKAGLIIRQLPGVGDDLPMYFVNWNEARAYCAELNRRNPGFNYRLPTEAEWEYSCRAGTTSPFHFGSTISTNQANYDGRLVYGDGSIGMFREQTTKVGMFPPNNWGLYDMHGNVNEWCEDVFIDTYEGAPSDGSPITGQSLARVVRGGSWDNGPARARSAGRLFGDSRHRYQSVGFRIAYDASDEL